MSKETDKYDNNGNLVYHECIDYEFWKEYDQNNNLIHYRNSTGFEYWYKYAGNNTVHYKDSNEYEIYYKFEDNKRIEITKKEFDWIEFKKKEKEFNSREKVSRFSIMDI